jgi:hypothetical protein
VVEYEVTCALDPSVADAWRRWIDGHAAEVVAAGGFSGASVLRVDGAAVPTWVVRYVAPSIAVIEAYLHEHAPRLRADATARFGDGMVASRRVLVREVGG